MKKIAIFAGVAIVMAGGLAYFISGSNPKLEQYQGVLGSRVKVAGGKICVQQVGDYSKKSLEMQGVDELLVEQLRRAGLDATLAAAAGETCDATVHTEIVEIGRKSAAVDFRLAAKSQQMPILSASVKGKSDGQSASGATGPGNSFLPKAKTAQDGDAAVKGALASAFEEQASRIAKGWTEFAAKSK